jgi:uncharacterized protein (DUF2384 family)
MRPPEDFSPAESERIAKLCRALEHAVHSKVLGLVMCKADGDIFIVCAPGLETQLPRLLGQARWETVARVAEEWRG